jgi:hypothetical protein
MPAFAAVVATAAARSAASPLSEHQEAVVKRNTDMPDDLVGVGADGELHGPTLDIPLAGESLIKTRTACGPVIISGFSPSSKCPLSARCLGLSQLAHPPSR